MRANTGANDRTIRLAVGVMLTFVALETTGIWVWIAAALAVAALLTGITGFCPTYKLLGVATRPSRAASAR